MDTSKGYKNTYHGLNHDLAKSKYDNKVYYDAQNMRIVAHTDQTTGASTNIRGTLVAVTLPTIFLFQSNGDGTFTYRYNLATGDDTLNYVYYTCPFDFTSSGPLGPQTVIGYANIRNKLILFAVADNDTSFDENTMGFIWEFDPNGYGIELKYMHRLQFQQSYPIEAVGNYENEYVQKIYWVDGYNELRHLNIADPDLKDTPLDFVNIVPEVEFSDVTLSGVYHGSGSFNSGRIAYAYSYINQYGAETKISPLSLMYGINPASDGALVNTNVGISFEITIPNLRTDFDYIRVYRLHYELPEADPTITLFKEEPVTSTSLTFIDDGTEEIAAVSLPQFQLMGTDPFISYTLAPKDNRLFVANNKYKFFDVGYDCRAYRFNNVDEILVTAPSARIETSTGGYSLVHATGQLGLPATYVFWGDVPSAHDCINPSVKAETDVNNVFTLPTQTEDAFFNTYIYQSDGTTIGAEGPNVKIGVTTVKMDPHGSRSNELSNLKFPTPNGSYLNQTNTSNIGFKRDETYRIGVVFFNNRGQQSFVQWVCDFRMPHVINPGGIEYPLIDSSTKEFNQLQLTFEFKSAAVTALQALGVVGYRVVRVHRNYADKTVQAQGMLGSFITGTDTGDLYSTQPPPYMALYGDSTGVFSGRRQWPWDWQTGSNQIAVYESGGSQRNYSSSIVEFRSPDLDLNIQPSGYFIVHGAAKVTGQGVVQKDDIGNPVTADNFIWSDASSTNTSRTDQVVFSEEITTDGIVRIDPYLSSNYLLYDRGENIGAIIDDGTNPPITISNSHALIIDTSFWYHSICNYGLFTKIGQSSAEAITNQIGTTLFTYAADGSRYILLADFKRRLPNQYGGNTYADRTRNSYIDSSAYTSLSTSPVSVYGDTYTTNMRYQRSQYWTDQFGTAVDGNTGCVRDMYFIPCEMSINDDLRDSSYTLASTGTGLGRKDRYFITLDQFHQYNPIYHYIDKYSIIRAAKPLGYQQPTVFDIETKYSDLKKMGELFDSWVSFAPGNINNVDGIHGPIQRLIVNRDIMFYFQDYGYGVWNINPNVAVTGEDGTSIEIGTGAVLHEYQYLSTNGGCQHKWSIVGHPFGMMWYDQLNRKVRMIQGNENLEANLQGINTYLQNLPDLGNNPLLSDGVNAGYYKRTNESYITFHAGDMTRTYIFYNPTKAFVSRMTMYPRIYMQGNTGLFLSVSNKIEHFDNGQMGIFNSAYNPSYITIMINGDPDIVKVLNNLQWNSEYYDSTGAEQSLKTITHIRIWNDYQDTGLVALDDDNSERLLRDWRFTVPMVGDTSLDRMRSQYHFIQLYFDDNSNSKVVMHDLISYVVLQT